MKLKKLIFLGICASVFFSCSTDDGKYTEPISMYEKIGGRWNLSRIKQVDELAIANQSGLTEVDLTDFFENFSITLNVNESNQPLTFVTSGAPEILPVEGYWKLDSTFQNWDGKPVNILFFEDSACTIQTGKVSITSVPGSVPLMEFTLTRSSNGIPFVSYVYTLIPVMQINQ